MATIIVLLVCALLIGWFSIGIVYQTAKNNRQLTFNNTGEIKFVVEGGKIIKVIMDVPGMVYNVALDLIVEPESIPSRSGFMAWFYRLMAKRYKIEGGSQTGIAYVSIFYPVVRVLTWDFHWLKLEPKTKREDEQTAILERYNIVDKHDPNTSSLYYEYNYPVHVIDIELQMNTKISVMLVITLVVRRPVYLIGNLKGKFMPQVTSEVSGLVDNGLSHMTIEDWRNSNKEKEIDKIFKKKKTILHGGFGVKGVSYVTFDYAGNTPEIIKAINARQVATEEGKAKVIAAEQDAMAAEQEKKATISRGQGEAEALRLKNEAIHSSPHGAAIYMADRQVDAINAFGGSTLVLGDNKSMISVPADNSRSKGKKEEKKGGENFKKSS